MFTVWRSALGTVVGVVAFGLLVISIEAAGMLIYPPPPGNYHELTWDQKSEYMAAMPVSAFMLVLAAWACGTFVGGYLAAYIARAAPLIHAGIIGGLCLLATGQQFREMPHPEWFVAVAPLAIIVAAFTAGALAAPKEGGPSIPGEAVVGPGSGGAKPHAGGRRSA